MTESNKTRYYSIGGIRFQANILSPFFNFDDKGGSHLFQNSPTSDTPLWILNINSCNKNTLNSWTEVFKGSEKFEKDLPYKWSVIKQDNLEGIYAEFEDKTFIDKAVCYINTKEQTVDIQVKHSTIKNHLLDPFFHPLGILLLQYIVHFYGGFVIHASTVDFKGRGYLFSAVSGTGKSTMAGLWQKCGATIINDDRLIIIPGSNGFQAFNTPMPFYQDTNKNILLHKLFLIKQSPDNYLKKLPTLKGALGLMGNCMQFQYNEAQVQNRLNALLSLSESCGVYECGFKPDTDIVELILNEFGE